MIFKLVPDAFFANAKTMKAFVDTDLKLVDLRMKMVDKRKTHESDFVISSQDFHIEFVKTVINLKNSYLTFKPGSSQNGRFQEGPGGRELSSQNENFPFQTGELEHMQSLNV